MTNRQWLESLTDEQLAYVFVEVGCGCCAYTMGSDDCLKPEQFNNSTCIKGTAKWLKQEHTEDDEC